VNVGNLLRATAAFVLWSATAGAERSSAAFAPATLTGHVTLMVAKSDPRERPLDLPAMALRPDDLETQGLHGFGASNSVMTDDSGAAGAFLREYRGDPGGVAGDAIDAAAPTWTYVLHLVLPGTEGDPSSGTLSRVVSYVMEFDDDTASGVAFPILADAWQSGDMHAVPTQSNVGDEHVLVSGAGQEETGELAPYQRVDLLFRTGRLIAGVSVEKYAGLPTEAPVVENLAAQQMTRISDVLTGDQRGLGARALRLHVAGEKNVSDKYTVLGGAPVRVVGETTAQYDQRGADVLGDRIVEGFDLEQQVAGAFTSDPPLAYYHTRLATFEDAKAAFIYLQASGERLAQAQLTDLQAVDAPAVGDGASAFTYGFTRADGVAFSSYRIVVRVGAEVFSINLGTTEVLDPEAVNELAAQQAECLEGIGCVSSVPVPPSLAQPNVHAGPPTSSAAGGDVPGSTQ
jgi:hypothetical protein